MDVIDRYFRTLRILLPRDRRDDILRELSEEVHSQVAEREAALGRPLDASERAAILSAYGHPVLTAARYRPQRSLIGPVVFPYYWIVLKIALLLVVASHVVGGMMLLVGNVAVVPIGDLVETAIGSALKVVGWITALGAVADFFLARSHALEKWTPPAAPQTSSSQHRATEPAIAGLVVSTIVGLWWLAGLRFPALFFGPGAAGLEWGPGMDRLYPVLVVTQGAMLAGQFIRYLRPESGRLLHIASPVWLVAGLALVYLVATSDHEWMVWRADATVPGDASVVRLLGRDVSLLKFVNAIWSVIFIAVAVSSGWALLRGLLRRFRDSPATALA